MLVIAAAYMGQRSLIFPAPVEGREPEIAGGRFHRIAGNESEAPVFAFHFPAAQGAPTIVHFHGNGEQLADQIPVARGLHARGLGVFAVEYPGYGLAAREDISETAIYAAAERSIMFLRDRLGVPLAQIVLEGDSLGTGVATEMARRRLGSRLVLLAPYTSMVDMAASVLPYLPTGLLVRDRFDTAAKAPSIAVPVLILHGGEDPLIPLAMGRRLSQLFPDARLEVIEGGHHGDLWAYAPTRMMAWIDAFARGAE